MPAQFQLALELTNIVNPLSQALSAFRSLAVIDAIKKAGSDALTEMKLASWIGRLRIDEAIAVHFRHAVGKSDQHILSRYLDIVLESGAGPTVQEALKNPAMFSMVIQLSALAFAHDKESLANAIVEAMERVVKEAGRETDMVPDYVSLLDTLQACQQQTAAFSWAGLFEAAERKLDEEIRSMPFNARSNMWWQAKPWSPEDRALDFTVLQSLLMWLPSLQNFPEDRLLYLRCYIGFSTIVVWCHHILGHTVTISFQSRKLTFKGVAAKGEIFVELSAERPAAGMIMDTADPGEPLFSLAKGEDGLELSSEKRVEAYGFGLKVIQREFTSHKGTLHMAHVIQRARQACNNHGLDLSDDHIIEAGQFLFALEPSEVYEAIDAYERSDQFRALSEKLINLLVLLLLALARIQGKDRERCRALPLCYQTFIREVRERPILISVEYFNVIKALELLTYLLLGQSYMTIYEEREVMVSAWGWSVYFDTFDTTDPAEAPVNTLRVVCGVPSRSGQRCMKMVDGPVDHHRILMESVWLQNIDLKIERCLGGPRRGPCLVGKSRNAFIVNAIFYVARVDDHRDHREHRYRLGFRQMQELGLKVVKMRPCEHVYDNSQTLLQELKRARHSSSDRVPGSNGARFFFAHLDFSETPVDSECEKLFKRCGNSGSRWFYYSASNAHARWLALVVFHRLLHHDRSDHVILLNCGKTCSMCAVRYPILDGQSALVIL